MGGYIHALQVTKCVHVVYRQGVYASKELAAAYYWCVHELSEASQLGVRDLWVCGCVKMCMWCVGM